MTLPSRKKFDIDNDVPDLTGKVIVITEGNAGIGAALCLHLARHNPKHIYILARNPLKSTSTISSIQAIVPNTLISFIPMNLASISSVQTAAKSLISLTSRLDLLYCNAGILDWNPRLTEDNYEIHFGTNHLGHALLVKLLLPLLHSTSLLPFSTPKFVRIITTSSDGYRFHARGGIKFSTLNTPQTELTHFGFFGPWLRYIQSKLANIMYTSLLAKRYPELIFISVHPGIIDTPLTPSLIKNTWIIRRLTVPNGDVKIPEEGAWNLVWAGTTEEVVSGAYYEPVGMEGKRTKESLDEGSGERLWGFTEDVLRGFEG